MQDAAGRIHWSSAVLPKIAEADGRQAVRQRAVVCGVTDPRTDHAPRSARVFQLCQLSFSVHARLSMADSVVTFA